MGNNLYKMLESKFRETDGSTPLHQATSQTELATLLVEEKPINVQNKHGTTPLLAILKMYTRRKWGIFTPKAPEIKHMVEFLINHNADVTLADTRGITPLHEVARIDFNSLACHAESALDFLKHEKIIMDSDCSIDTIKFKLVQPHEIFPGQIACNIPWVYRSYFEIIDEYTNACKILDLLIDHGVDINAQTDIGITPFHRVIRHGTLKIIEYFIGHGANVNIPDHWGKTPLFYLLGRDNENSISKKLKLLIKHGADIMALDKDCNTLLHRACYFGHKKAVELLLSHNHPINPQNRFGMTPLHQAVLGFLRNPNDYWSSDTLYLEIIELLLKSHADINAQNNYGWTAYQLINRRSYHTSSMRELLNLLLVFGADKKLGQRIRIRT